MKDDINRALESAGCTPGIGAISLSSSFDEETIDLMMRLRDKLNEDRYFLARFLDSYHSFVESPKGYSYRDCEDDPRFAKMVDLYEQQFKEFMSIHRDHKKIPLYMYNAIRTAMIEAGRCFDIRKKQEGEDA